MNTRIFLLLIFSFNISLAAKQVDFHDTNEMSFIYVSASVLEEQVKVNWELSGLTDASIFMVERSSDAINFEVIDTVYLPLNGTNFESIDASPINGIAYYRIHCISANKTELISNICYAEFETTPLPETFVVINAFPMPFISNFYVNLKCKNDMVITTRINDMYGRFICECQHICQKGINKIELNETLIDNNLYQLIILDDLMNSETIHVLKQKLE